MIILFKNAFIETDDKRILISSEIVSPVVLFIELLWPQKLYPLKSFGTWVTGLLVTSRCLYFKIFSDFLNKQHNFFNKNMENYSSSIRCWDSNLRSLERESLLRPSYRCLIFGLNVRQDDQSASYCFVLPFGLTALPVKQPFSI